MMSVCDPVPAPRDVRDDRLIWTSNPKGMKPKMKEYSVVIENHNSNNMSLDEEVVEACKYELSNFSNYINFYDDNDEMIASFQSCYVRMVKAKKAP